MPITPVGMTPAMLVSTAVTVWAWPSPPCSDLRDRNYVNRSRTAGGWRRAVMNHISPHMNGAGAERCGEWEPVQVRCRRAVALPAPFGPTKPKTSLGHMPADAVTVP